MELNDKNISTAIGLKEDLEYMIDRFKTDELGYVNLEDLKKARWYLDRLIKSVENAIYPEYMSSWVGAVQDITKEDVIYANGKYYVAKE